MLIRCKLFRDGGSRIVLGKGKEARHYHFKAVDQKSQSDDPAEDHVCDVTDPDDIGTFLGIKEGYEVHASELKSRVQPAAAAEAKAPKAPKAPKAEVKETAPAAPKNYGSLKKPDLLKLVAERTVKQPHGTTATSKLIETLEALDRAAK